MKPPDDELSMLREKCRIMRNLLRDISENENILEEVSYASTSNDDFERAIQARAAQRKALVDEIDFFLVAEEYHPELKV